MLILSNRSWDVSWKSLSAVDDRFWATGLEVSTEKSWVINLEVLTKKLEKNVINEVRQYPMLSWVKVGSRCLRPVPPRADISIGSSLLRARWKFQDYHRDTVRYDVKFSPLLAVSTLVEGNHNYGTRGLFNSFFRWLYKTKLLADDDDDESILQVLETLSLNVLALTILALRSSSRGTLLGYLLCAVVPWVEFDYQETNTQFICIYLIFIRIQRGHERLRVPFFFALHIQHTVHTENPNMADVDFSSKTRRNVIAHHCFVFSPFLRWKSFRSFFRWKFMVRVNWT